MTDFIRSQIRTWVPIGVGGLLAYLSGKLDISFDEGTANGLVLFIGSVAMGVYYAAARWLESRFPWAGYLLGSRGQPAYETPPE